MQRRILYVALYEGLALVLSTAIMQLATEQGAGRSGLVAALASLVAVTWNYLYNTGFEAWEARRAGSGRSWRLRAAHTAGFEAGMTLWMLPLFTALLGTSLAEGLALQTGMLLFFLVYNFVFTLGFDRVFGLPASALR